MRSAGGWSASAGAKRTGGCGDPIWPSGPGGTVGEDYSPDGDAWEYLTYDQARCRAYRWSEDGLGGLCDERQRLCLALALWNGRDPILKERAFGLTGHQGNHGEDVKELYFYVDATPSHSYLRYHYFYPQAGYPYARLVAENARRSRHDPPFNLLDTGVFDDNRYWDVQVYFAKAAPDEIHAHIYAYNNGPDAATLHLLPTLWFRNDWSWGDAGAEKPVIRVLLPPLPAPVGPCRPSIPRWAPGACTARCRGRCCSRTMRPTPSGYGARPIAIPM